MCAFGFNYFGFNGVGFNGVGYIYVTYRLHIGYISVTYKGVGYVPRMLTSVTYIKVKSLRDFRVGFFVFFSRVWFQCSVSVSNWYLGILESSA